MQHQAPFALAQRLQVATLLPVCGPRTDLTRSLLVWERLQPRTDLTNDEYRIPSSRSAQRRGARHFFRLHSPSPHHCEAQSAVAVQKTHLIRGFGANRIAILYGSMRCSTQFWVRHFGVAMGWLFLKRAWKWRQGAAPGVRLDRMDRTRTGV